MFIVLARHPLTYALIALGDEKPSLFSRRDEAFMALSSYKDGINDPFVVELMCDRARHLVCEPYSKENLHFAARALGIGKHWFHRDHYDIPKTRIREIMLKCTVVSSKDVLRVIKNQPTAHTNAFAGWIT